MRDRGVCLFTATRNTRNYVPYGPPQIQYPANSAAQTGVCNSPNCTIAAGAGYPWLRQSRDANLMYRRLDNFKQGDLGSAIVYGAPLRGSPRANFITHDSCNDDHDCYVHRSFWMNRELRYETNDTAIGRPDAGTAIYDLSIGSNAYQLFHNYDSAPIRVYAIGTTANGSAPFTQRGLWFLARHPEYYCPGFGPGTSDLIVPLSSQLANLTHRIWFPNCWHQVQDESPRVIGTVAQLLADKPGQGDPEMQFDDRFPADADPIFPLNCGVLR